MGRYLGPNDGNKLNFVASSLLNRILTLIHGDCIMHRNIMRALVFVLFLTAAGLVHAGEAIIEADVDGSDFLIIQGNTVNVEHRNFEPLSNLLFQFQPTYGIPKDSLSVRVTKLNGTGPVTIIGQPSFSNNYSLKILIDNDQEETYPQHYRIRLEWDEYGTGDSGQFDRRRNDFLHWQGMVDGTDILRVWGREVKITHVRAKPIENQRYNFSTPLPRRSVKVSLSLDRGRGDVKIVQQPDYANNYTALIRVDDGRHRGADAYDFYLFWEKDDTSVGYNEDDYDFVWEGRVDGVDRLLIRDQRVQVEHVRSKPLKDVNFNFKKRLPRSSQTVTLQAFKGRGRITILHQPSPWNDYSIKILLDDSKKSGSSLFRFGLKWEGGRSIHSGGHGRHDGYDGQSGGVIRWRGKVDGRDQLIIRGNHVEVKHLEANPIRNMSQTFSSPLPKTNVQVNLNIIDGRGKVRIIEQPSRSNNYALIIEIHDKKGGSDNYEFELYW